MPRKSTRDVKPDVRDQDVYVIKSILEYERRKGADYYLVEWLGYPIDQATWEPRSNFVDPDVETLERLTSLKAQYLEEKKKPSAISLTSTQSNGTTPTMGKLTVSLDVSKAGAPEGEGEFSQLGRLSTHDPLPSKRRVSRLSNGSSKRARTMTASNGPADNFSGMLKFRPEEHKRHIEDPSSEIPVQETKQNKQEQTDVVSSEAPIPATHPELALLNQEEAVPSTNVPNVPVEDLDTAPSPGAETDEDHSVKMSAMSKNAGEDHQIPSTTSANEILEEDTLSPRRSRIRRRDSQEAPPLPSSPTYTTETAAEVKNHSLLTRGATQTASATKHFTSPTKPVQSETADAMPPTKPSSKEPFAHSSHQSAAQDTGCSPKTTSQQLSDASSDPTTSATRQRPKMESLPATTKPVVEKTPIAASEPLAAAQNSCPPTNAAVPPSPATSRTESLAGAQEPASPNTEEKAVAPVTVEQVRVKSLRQDDTHGLCGTITRTNSLGEVEELRLPISEVRGRYPEELIDFLLQRIQFRSIRCSTNSNSTAPTTVPTPN